MAYDDRKPILQKIEKARRGRALLCFFNFDRQSNPAIQGLSSQFHADSKEALFRVLKDSATQAPGVDLCLYTRGGDTNAVWPIVSLIREFDPDFEVLIPFRCHSAGTLVAMGAKRIHLGPISELSPIDPSTGNQFNPTDPSDKSARLPISVEDVQAYRSFILDSVRAGSESTDGDDADEADQLYLTFLQKLVAEVHPLALGNVHRVHQQIKKLGAGLLDLHPVTGRDTEKVVKSLASRFHSHLHMISRQEAREILGPQQAIFAPPELAAMLDELLRAYEEQFQLRRSFFLSDFIGDNAENDVRFVCAVIESKETSFLYETKAKVSQNSRIPPGVQIQLPAGQRIPLIPGLPREYHVEVTAQGWIRNKEPKGVTL